MKTLHQYFEKSVSRRQTLKTLGLLALACALPIGCKKQYVRKQELLYLGTLEQLLFAKQHVRESAMLVFLDDLGWSSLSTQCTVEGCDLTYGDDTLACPCCESVYSHRGKIIHGEAKLSLPWYEVSFTNNALYANSGRTVNAEHRFTTPALSSQLGKLRELIAQEQKKTPIPKILKGGGDGEPGQMFIESSPEAIFEQEMNQQGIK